MKKTLLMGVGHSAAWLLLCASGWAQTGAPNEADPPDRAGRLSYVQGAVSMQPAGEEQWTAAEVNRPLTTGDRLWTDRDSRAELYAAGAAIRLGSESGFSFLNLDDNTIQMRLTAGTVDVRVRRLDADDQIEIDTPNLALSLLRPGNYRVEVNEAGDATVVKVSEGEAEATGGPRSVVVHAQQSATFSGTEQLASSFGTLGAPDAFDQWALDRDRRDDRAETASAQYVSPDVVGAEDLNDYGSWSSDPDYGYVWTPTAVAVDWSPYRYGRWAWVAPWGWTWIDEAPWGFAPFHYGRWAHVSNRWCWVPGPRHVRPVYAPALVGWVGGSDIDVAVRVGGGGVAWFPLAPREVYVPAYRVSPRYVTRVNVTNTVVNNVYVTNVYEKRVTNITYRNRVVPGAVMAVPRNSFASAEPVARHAVRVDEKVIARGTVRTGAPEIRPEPRRESGSSEAARRIVRTPPAAVVDREVVAKRPPPAASARFVRKPEPGSFADRQPRVEERPAQATVEAPQRLPPAVRETPENRGALQNREAREDRPPSAQDRLGARTERLEKPEPANPSAQPNQSPQPVRQAHVDEASRNDKPAAQGPSQEAERGAAADRVNQQRERLEQQVQQHARMDQQQHDQAEQQRSRMEQQQRDQAEQQRSRMEQQQRDQAEQQRSRMEQQQQRDQQQQRERVEQQRARMEQQRKAAEAASAGANSPQRDAARVERQPKPAERAEQGKRPDPNRRRPDDDQPQR